MIRLLKPLKYYEERYSTWMYGLNKLYLLMEKQHNRGQEGAGLACVKQEANPGEEYMFRERALSPKAITEIFGAIQSNYKDLTKGQLHDADFARRVFPFAGEVYMGHLRYSTTGKSGISYVHPFLKRNNWRAKNLALCGNFNMTNVDNLVIIDDLIVRGTTLKQSIIGILDRLNPKKIVIVSSSPQIRYPDYYSIDMSRMGEFIAFKAVGKSWNNNTYHKIMEALYDRGVVPDDKTALLRIAYYNFIQRQLDYRDKELPNISDCIFVGIGSRNLFEEIMENNKIPRITRKVRLKRPIAIPFFEYLLNPTYDFAKNYYRMVMIIEVLSPISLKEQVKEIVKNMSRYYNC